MSLIFREKTFHLRKRVPTRYAKVEARRVLWISLNTDSETVARRKAGEMWDFYLDAWEARLEGDGADAEVRFAAAANIAKARGFRFMRADALAKQPINAILDRVEAVAPRGEALPGLTTAAILGGVEEPPITVNRALELFWTLAKDRSLGKSEDQIRRWKNPRIKAINNLVGVIGDKQLATITADDMLDFRQWWVERLETEGLTPNSANKDLTHIADTLRTVVRMKKLGIVLPLSDLAFKGGEKRSRPPFSAEWIKAKLLAPGALAGLNTEARCVLLGMVNTGYRPSEGAGLMPDHIRLDGDVPFISIEPVGRQLKNQHSKRVIPLVGVSLDAFRECPRGFPTYRLKDKVSDTVNKFLRENGLLQTPGHSLYSLRHAFEDRLLAAGVDERIRRDLFGHALERERYGAGATLEHLQRVVASVAL
jgi:integrase